MRKRKYLIGALTLAFAASISAVAVGARTVQQSTVADVCGPKNAACKTPFKTPKRKYKPAKLHVVLAAKDSADPASCSTAPQATGACRVPPGSDNVAVDFDNDIQFNTNAVGKCNPATIAGDDTATARSQCAAGLVGTGTGFGRFGVVGLPGTGDIPVVISAFNSTNANQIIFHVKPTAVNAFALTGTLANSPQPGDFGKRLNTPVVTPGSILIRFDITINKGPYIKARCKDPNKKFDFHYLFHYGDQGSAPNNYPETTETTYKDGCKRKPPRRRGRR